MSMSVLYYRRYGLGAGFGHSAACSRLLDALLHEALVPETRELEAVE